MSILSSLLVMDSHLQSALSDDMIHGVRYIRIYHLHSFLAVHNAFVCQEG